MLLVRCTFICYVGATASRIAAGVWYTVDATVTGSSFSVQLGNTANAASATLTGTDAKLTWGSAGFYLDGALFPTCDTMR